MMMHDFTKKYNTHLPAEAELQFREWVEKMSRIQGRDVSKDLYDYDLRGFWASGEGAAENGHLSDRFKKPNHPTFSKESIYSGKDGYTGGEWRKETDGKYTFVASNSNLQFRSRKEMVDYFKQAEPDNNLVFPKTIDDPNISKKLFPKSL